MSSSIQNEVRNEKGNVNEGGVCHICREGKANDCIVGCKSGSCSKSFCRACLTSKFKYSKIKAANLPSPYWKCPACARRCVCAVCQAEGNCPKKAKLTRKKKQSLEPSRRRRKHKQQMRDVPKNGMAKNAHIPRCPCTKPLVTEHPCRTCGFPCCASCFSTGSCSKCTSPDYMRPQSAPNVQYQPISLPSLSGACNLDAQMALPLSLADFQTHSINHTLSRITHLPIYQPPTVLYEAYCNMPLSELVKVALIPLLCRGNCQMPKALEKLI